MIHQIRQGKRKMGKKVLGNISIIVCASIFLLMASPLFGQWTGTPGRRNVPVSESPCWTKPYMEVTPEQLKALEALHRSFYKDIVALRKKLVTERDELSCLLSSPKIDRKLVLSKQNSLSAIQMKIDEISIQYLLKARALFAPNRCPTFPRAVTWVSIMAQEWAGAGGGEKQIDFENIVDILNI